MYFYSGKNNKKAEERERVQKNNVKCLLQDLLLRARVLSFDPGPDPTTTSETRTLCLRGARLPPTFRSRRLPVLSTAIACSLKEASFVLGLRTNQTV